jgi:hypothetical protein
MRIELWVEAIQGRAIGTDDFLVFTHVEENMRMVVGGCRADTHEFPCADVDDRNARIIMEVGDDMFRHGNSSCAVSERQIFRRTIAIRPPNA